MLLYPLKNINRKFTLKSQIKKLKSHFKTLEIALSNIPGKYLLNLIKSRLENLSLIFQLNLDSFTYKLSKEVDISELNYLKSRVINYIK
ncbi:MAG: hypothetical protein A3F72_15070 [Bacteroidetes bacterium RIFCSPLOWO2_12_FULL_35_15]|nr:MAG: hypothetical protein A3F72_15070 [Bacteroidetes bacterium RIFCSPLOWO2_12_FULL_35_15]